MTMLRMTIEASDANISLLKDGTQVSLIADIPSGDKEGDYRSTFQHLCHSTKELSAALGKYLTPMEHLEVLTMFYDQEDYRD